MTLAKQKSFATALLLALAAALPAFAANTCTVKGSGINFGNYSAALKNITGTVTVTCTKGLTYGIALNAGLGPGATITSRAMTGSTGATPLAYGLYTNAAHSINWGDSLGTNWVTGTGTGKAQKFNIYGQIPANKYVTVASYTDTITASVEGAGFATATTRFLVKASALAHCTVSSTTLAFGAYTGAVNNATSVISVTCSDATSYTIGLNAGKSRGATITKRAMTGPRGALLHYDLYSNAARTLNWGNTAATNWVTGSGIGSTQSVNVYGQVPAAQSLAPGSYTDTIVATLTY